MPAPQRRRRALLVINESSRQGQVLAESAAGMLERDLDLRRELCPRPDDLQAAIRRAAGSVDLVVLGGGDGTLNSAAPALVETGLPLGILPLGTANDLARTLGLPTDLAKAVQGIVDGDVRRLDLGEVKDRKSTRQNYSHQCSSSMPSSACKP